VFAVGLHGKEVLLATAIPGVAHILLSGAIISCSRAPHLLGQNDSTLAGAFQVIENLPARFVF
jgi:hypothetical protein